MNRIYKLAIASALSVGSLSLASCATIPAALTAPAPTTTVAEAEQAATLAWQLGATYVSTVPQSPAAAAQEHKLSESLHSALIAFENASAANSSAASAAFTSALAAYKAYTKQPT